jgi:hypothetical protein
VRDYPAEGKGSVQVKLIVGREMVHGGVKTVRAAVARSPDVDTRPRREREGMLAWPTKEKIWRGKKGGAVAMGCSFKRARRGGEDGPREAPHGVGRAARCGRQRPGSGARGRHMTGAEIGRRGTARWLSDTVTGSGI